MALAVQEAKDMIIVMKHQATKEHVDHVVERIIAMGYRPHVSQGEETTIVGVIGHSSPEQLVGL